MKLKTYNPETCPVVRNAEAFIHINTKTGLFTINKFACDKMGIKDGDHIVMHNDEENLEEWYLQNLGKKKEGFELREKNSISSGFLFNNVGLTRKIAESVLFEGISGRLKIGEEKTIKGVGNLWTIITASLRNK